jgi:hypothetical protein
MIENNVKNDNPEIDEPPPILSSWKQIYGIVFLNLVLLIILFYIFTEVFS